MAYTTIDKPSDYFNTKLYTGTGASNSQTVGFQPDFTWIKNRSIAEHHILTDSVRGAPLNLYSNLTNAENNTAEFLKSFDSNGFTVGTSVEVNGSSNNMASWNWKANGAGVANTDGSISSTVSANTTSGFSIVSYTGNGSNGASFGHGLGVKPKIVLIKNRTTAKNWVYWQDTTNNGTSDVRLCLNLTNANFNNFHVTFGTSTITLGDTDDAWNKSGDNLIAYCFAEKQGYSKFGSYTGNGSTDGTFVYTGFKPAFVMLKSSSSGSVGWITHDNKRIGFNPNNYYVEPNNSNAESADTDKILLLSNGFKLTSTSATWNASGGSYIYMAFAEEPLVGDNPATAR